MNAERMLEVADAIEAEEVADFNMADYFSGKAAHEVLDRWDGQGHCGTAACIAGFTTLLYPPGYKVAAINPYNWARYALDLTDEAAELLFIDTVPLFLDRPSYAAKWLRDLAEGRKTFKDLRRTL